MPKPPPTKDGILRTLELVTPPEYHDPFIEDLEGDSHLRPKGSCKYRTGSFICVPLLIKGKLVGVMDVNEKRSGESLNQDDLNLLTTIAGQVSIALENAKLYGVLQENALRPVGEWERSWGPRT